MEINGGRSSWPCDSHGCASPRYILNYNRRRAFPQVLIPRIVHSTTLVAGGPWQTFRQTTAPTPLWPTRRPFFRSNQSSLGTLGLRLATPCRTCTWSRSRGSSQARLKPLAFRTSYLHACELVAFRVCSHTRVCTRGRLQQQRPPGRRGLHPCEHLVCCAVDEVLPADWVDLRSWSCLRPFEQRRFLAAL